MSEWKAHISEAGFARNHATVYVYRRTQTGVQFATPDGSYEDVDEAMQPPESVAHLLPWDALDALRDAIDAQRGTRYDESLVKELRGQVEVERARVDRVLGSLLSPPTSPLPAPLENDVDP